MATETKEIKTNYKETTHSKESLNLLLQFHPFRQQVKPTRSDL